MENPFLASKLRNKWVENFKKLGENTSFWGLYVATPIKGYNTFGIGISLTQCNSFYHTVDASFMNHQTSVPVCVDNDYVYFNHKSFFIFVWGNGKSDKRLWLEERGHDITGSRVSQSDFERYFELFSDTEKHHGKTNGWI